jgi:hypothetical protein
VRGKDRTRRVPRRTRTRRPPLPTRTSPRVCRLRRCLELERTHTRGSVTSAREASSKDAKREPLGDGVGEAARASWPASTSERKCPFLRITACRQVRLVRCELRRGEAKSVVELCLERADGAPKLGKLGFLRGELAREAVVLDGQSVRGLSKGQSDRV